MSSYTYLFIADRLKNIKLKGGKGEGGMYRALNDKHVRQTDLTHHKHVIHLNIS